MVTLTPLLSKATREPPAHMVISNGQAVDEIQPSFVASCPLQRLPHLGPRYALGQSQAAGAWGVSVGDLPGDYLVQSILSNWHCLSSVPQILGPDIPNTPPQGRCELFSDPLLLPLVAKQHEKLEWRLGGFLPLPLFLPLLDWL